MRAVSWPIVRTLWRNPRMLAAPPALNAFLLRYMRKFRVRRVGEHHVVHSHLPPLNSRAYSRFVTEHLLGRSAGPSHAQVGLTNACPQRCGYCYNRDRAGQPMDTATILSVVRELKRLGVFWLGWTGGEPLLNRDILRITEEAADGCAVKLFTTGSTLTPVLAADLKRAGLFSVSVSLDHWKKEVHDANRGVDGAFTTALRAIEMFLAVDGLHVSVSAVLSRDMIGDAERYINYLEGLGVHEAWLSEVKPSVPACWDEKAVITEAERLALVRLQDACNRRGRMTVNYLGHFEGREHFGCTAGNKMVYVDAFGEVGPCVFAPMTLGNVRERPLARIVADMRSRFPTEQSCFVNRNYPLFRAGVHADGRVPLGREASVALLEQVRFGPFSRFFELHARR